jgi:hypothetical protein
MFTKYMYIWIQFLVDNGFSYDWHTHLSSEAQSELQVWITYAVTWSKKALWRSASTVLWLLRMHVILQWVVGLVCLVGVSQYW